MQQAIGGEKIMSGISLIYNGISLIEDVIEKKDEAIIIYQLTNATVTKIAEEGLVVIADLGRYPEIPVGTLDRIFETVIRSMPQQTRIICVNVGENILMTFEKCNRITEELNKRKMLLLTLTEEGNCSLWGEASDEARKILAKLWENEVLSRTTLSTEMLKEIDELVLNNHQIFTINSHKNEYSLSVLPSEIYDLLNDPFASDLMDVIEKSGAHFHDPCFLLSGKHAGEYFSIYRICDNKHILGRIVRQMQRRLRSLEVDKILTFSNPAAGIAHDLSERLEIPFMTFEDRQATKIVTEKDLKEGQKIVIITDVISTGELLENMISYVERKSCEVVKIIAVVDTENCSNQKVLRNMTALAKYKVELYDEGNCPYCENGIKHLEPNPFTLLPKFPELTPEQTKIFPENADKIIDPPEQFTFSEFWNMVIKTNALSPFHIERSGRHDERHHEHIVYTRKIVDNEEFCDDIVQKIVSSYTNLRPDIILCPHNDTAPKIGNAICIYGNSRGWNSKLQTAEFIEGFFKANIEENRKILIIDDGANTGFTIQGLLFLLMGKKNIQRVGCVVFLDRLSKGVRCTIEECLSRLFFSLYKSEIRHFPKDQCDICKLIDNIEKALRFNLHDDVKYQLEQQKEYLSLKFWENL